MRYATVMLLLAAPAVVHASDPILADGRAWPGRAFVDRNGTIDTLLVRPGSLSEGAVPRVQSVTLLDGRVVFCSGLDRSLFEMTSTGERRLRNGGYLVRQVRTDTDGTLYWSGLETPLESNPLPDGFIYSWNPTTGESRTEMTFSQGDVGRDWWGAFDVRDGRITVGTLTNRTRLYDISESPVRQLAELPISATAFRYADDGSLWACDGQGTLYRFADLTRPESSEVVLRSAVPFVDFVVPAP